MRWLDGITDSVDMSFQQALGDGDGQGNRACCSPWGRKELDTTERLNNNNIQKAGAFQVALAVKNPPANGGERVVRGRS